MFEVATALTHMCVVDEYMLLKYFGFFTKDTKNSRIKDYF